MTIKWFWSLLWVTILTGALQGQSQESILRAVQEKSQWSPADKPISYDKKTIDALDRKHASAINRYGLAGVTVQNWQGPSGTVHLTLYEMLDTSAAYGLFTLDRNIDQPGFATIPLGTEGFRVGNRTEFWQSKYVVKLEGSAAATDDLARIVSENILGRSRKPPVSTHLPPANLIQGSDKYIVDASGISRELNIDPQLLGFDDSVEVATASYRVGGKMAHLVLLMYPTQQIAKKYEDLWATTASDDASSRKRVGALLALVRGSREPSLAKAILEGVNYETQVTWDEPRPDLSLREVILTIFTFIGVALLFTIVVGVSFGGLRIFVKARYPDRVFDRPEDMEIIQLKLGQGLIQKQLRE
jgi:Family of unknown function (DUF6599)